jgi:hypothetical protein
VIWCITAANRVAQAVDADRNPDGNQAVRTDHTGRWLVRQLTRERPTPEAGEALHKPHIATCTSPPPPRQPNPPRTHTGVRPHRWQR